MEQEKKVIRRYNFTQKQLKEKLKLEGDITKIQLWSGRSPNMVKDGISQDVDLWAFETENYEIKEDLGNEGKDEN